MKKRLLLFFLSGFCCVVGFAQSYTYSVKGEVKDSLSGTVEPYATVRLLSTKTGRAVAVGTSDADGRFSIGTNQAGTYDLQVVTIGKAPLKRRIELSERHPVELGTLLLSEYSNALGEATVTAQRPIVKSEVDRIAYSVSDDPEAQSSSLLDVLRKVPMVTVDGEDNIKVNGSSSFKVYVNGKPNQMMSSNPSLILKNYPASAIKKVEVITDPGAKYDAEGVAGILNIVTETNAQTSGYTLSPSINPSNRGVFGSLFAMAQFGKFTISANYGIGYNKDSDTRITSERETFADDTNHFLYSEGTQKAHGTFQFGDLDASYEFDDKDLLSVSAGIHGYNGRNTSQDAYKMQSVAGSTTYAYDLSTLLKMKNAGYNASADYQHSFAKEGQTLTLSYRYNTSPSSQESNTFYTAIVNVPYDLKDRLSDPDNHSTEHTAQADFTTPIGVVHTLATGVKYIYRINRSDNEEQSRTAGTADDFAPDEENSLRYRHRTDIAAAYGEYTLKLGSLTTRAGLRYEYSRFRVTYPTGHGEAFTSHFSDFVPSLNVAYNLSTAKMLKIGYNMRIGRPDISYLSPYVSRPTAESQSYGNPNLNSEKAHNYSLTYSSFAPKFSLNATLSYQVQTNGLTSYSFLDDEGVATTTYGNFLHTKDLELSTYINWTIFEGTSLYLNARGSYADYKAYHYYAGANAHNSGFSANGFASIRQNLPLKFKLGIFGGGGTRSPNLQGRGTGFRFYGINLSRSFLADDRLTINLMASNFICPRVSFRKTTVTTDYRTSSLAKVDFLRFGIGIRYRIGSLKASVKKASRSIENDDVIQQSSSNSSESSQGTSGMGN